MTAIKFMIAAYVATWVIHGFYIGTLLARFRRWRNQEKELGRGK
jgi:hypothetical protein